ncbi:hypothetical protein [Candidatus Formimonas warabiya]|uniref:Uncharacterized protein n=1 Tax=Formimonas warabiya TaxID=1761012 RepID=A0A3G1KMZ9_FORW1|nr:hypothetical protein [Candidatus Formimonas warabiya]ATW23827.1 hypothetical protein DCMF_02560 [Candidatus Formimonas warabiya]
MRKLLLPLFLILLMVLISPMIFHRYTGQPASSSLVMPVFPETDLNGKILQGKSKIAPWSGWWWPFHVKMPPNLYNPKGPMDKYDQLSIARGQSNPGTMAWERENHYTDKNDEEWFGHCNGWAAAAVLEPKPENEKVISGVDFEVNDIMGLMSEWHWWDPAIAFYGSRYDKESDDINDIYPQEFHHVVIDFIGTREIPLIVDISGGEKEKDDPQVWNFPAFQYEFEYRPDDSDQEKNHVHCRLWYTDFANPESLRPKTFFIDYYYWIKGDKSNPTSGAWESAKDGGWGSHGDSRKNHPDFLWYPGMAKEHPVLKRDQYLEIAGQGENR